jgi:5'-3' exonuclease
MILVDYNQAALAGIFAFQEDIKAGKDVENIVRHAVINSLFNYKRRYASKYGELVICADARGGYWRKEIFKHYKGTRAKSREESDFPWDTVFNILNQLREDIKLYFPWRIVHIDKAEADDVIAILTKHAASLGGKKTGLYDDEEPVFIISSDHDFKQLHIYDGVKQWCPRQEKLITVNSKKEIKKLIIEHIVKGDSGDGIPNIRMPSSYFMKGKNVVPRQKSIKTSWLEEFYEKGIDACQSKFQRHRYQFNERLVSFEFIPDHIEQAILDYYKNNPPKGTKLKTLEYLTQHRCRLLAEQITEF